MICIHCSWIEMNLNRNVLFWCNHNKTLYWCKFLWLVGGPRLLNGVYFSRIYVAIGDFFDLSVNVTAYPVPERPEVKWTFLATNMTSSRTISSLFLQKLTILNISTFSYQLRNNSIDKEECGLYKVQLINKNGIFTTFYDDKWCDKTR